MADRYPLTLGGQGRSAAEVRSSAGVVFTLLLVGLVLGGALCLGGRLAKPEKPVVVEAPR